MIEYIDNPPKYNVGDTVVTRSYEVFKVSSIATEEISEWQKSAYEAPSLFGSMKMFSPKNPKKEYGRYKHTYMSPAGKTALEWHIVGAGVDCLAETITKMKEELEDAMQDLGKVHDIVQNYFE